jgi:hypothetical protein
MKNVVKKKTAQLKIKHDPAKPKNLGGHPKVWTADKIEAIADAFEVWMKKDDSIYYESFCVEMGINPENLSIWAKENERFAQVYAMSKVWQRAKLVSGGLVNKFNAGFTKFVLGNTSNWSDRQQVSVEESAINKLIKGVDGKTKDLI